MTPKLHGITEPLEAALIYAELGLAVVPIRKGTKRPPMKAWQKEATQDPEKIRQWWSHWPDSGVGVVTGEKSGGLAAFIDVEHALDPQYAARLGVNLDDLLVSQPSSGEEALQICEALVRSNAIDVIVVDSVAALVTKQELEGEIGDSTVGAQARLMSAALRKLTSFISKARTVCIFTNQIREKIGVMFGNPETTPGGRALKFYASVRVDIRRIGQIKGSDGVIAGNRTKIKVVKNKVAPPFTECEFDIMYNEGISSVGSLLDLATEYDIIQKRGSWISYNGSQIAQGRDAAKEALKSNPELYAEIEEQVKAKMDEKTAK